MSRVRDEGAEGSCVGFAVAAALECELHNTSGQDVAISPRYIYYYAREKGGFSTDADTGAHLKDAVEVVLHAGAVAEEVWPYKAGEFATKPPKGIGEARHYTIHEARRVRGLEELKAALWAFRPVVGGICVFQSFYSKEVARTGIIPIPDYDERVRGAAAVCFVGFDERPELLKFRTPWGPRWGDHGYGYIAYAYAERYLSDAWAIKM